jgi:hypothetical protein
MLNLFVIAQEQSPPTYCAPKAATNHVAVNASGAVTRNSGNMINTCVIKSANSLPKVLAPWLFFMAGNSGKIGLPNTPNNPWGSAPKAFQSVGGEVPKMLHDWNNMPISNSDLNGVPLDLYSREAIGTMGEYPTYVLRLRASATGLVIEKSIQANWSDSYYLKPVGANFKNYRVESYATCENSKYLDQLNMSGVGTHTGTRSAYDGVLGLPF